LHDPVLPRFDSGVGALRTAEEHQGEPAKPQQTAAPSPERIRYSMSQELWNLLPMMFFTVIGIVLYVVGIFSRRNRFACMMTAGVCLVLAILSIPSQR
jgi:hypothetical protein